MKKIYTVIAILAIFILTQFSCTKIDTTTLGTDLIPPIDNVNTFDTILDVVTDNDYMVDSTRISYVEDHALGIMSDPVFGTTQASLNFAITPPVNGTYPFISKDSVVGIDSVVLQLAYTGVYGDSMAQETFSVKELDPSVALVPHINGYRIDTIPPSVGYATTTVLNSGFTQNINELNDEKVLIRKPGDTTRISNVMRIPLPLSFGDRLKNYDTDSATNGAYRSDSLFRAHFRGFAIQNVSPATPGALAYFNLNSTNTKLFVYFRVKKLGGAGAIDTTSTAFGYSYYVNSNLLARTPGNGYSANIGNGNPNDQLLYIQSAPGSYASIKIPGLKTLTNRLIYRAELIVERDDITAPDQVFGTPGVLFLDAVDSSNSNRITAIPNYDFLAQNGSYNVGEFGGILRSDNTYRFTLTRFVQGVVTRKETPHTLRLHSAYYLNPYYHDPALNQTYPYNVQLSTKIGYGRVVVKGGAYPDPKKKMRLRIIYSKI